MERKLLKESTAHLLKGELLLKSGIALELENKMLVHVLSYCLFRLFTVYIGLYKSCVDSY